MLGLLAHHWLRAEDEDKAADYLLRAGDKARLEYALDEAIEHYRDLLPLLERRGERQEIALVLFKLALALHTSLRFAEANEAYQRAFEHWTPPEAAPGPASETLRMATSFRPERPRPEAARSRGRTSSSACSSSTGSSRRGPSGRSSRRSPSAGRSPTTASATSSTSARASTWSDGTPLTAHDVEFGIKRVLDPESPGSSVAIYFVLENGAGLRTSAGTSDAGTRSVFARSTTGRSSSGSSRRRRTS